MDEPTVEQLGGLPSPQDGRDFIGTGIEPEIPPAVYLPDYSALPVYNQLVPAPGASTSCGGCAGTKFQNVKLGSAQRLSFRALFAWTTKFSGVPPQEGTFGRAIMQALQKYGVPLESLHPNDNTLSIADFADPAKISQQAIVDALSRRIGAYAQITDLSMAGLKQAIYQNKCVIVLKSPWTPASWWPNPSNTGHFFILDGYDVSTLRFSNSFGADWHDQGSGRLTAEDVATLKEAWVAWEPTPPAPAPQPIPQPPQLPPNPSVPQVKNWLQRLLVWLGIVKAETQ